MHNRSPWVVRFSLSLCLTLLGCVTHRHHSGDRPAEIQFKSDTDSGANRTIFRGSQKSSLPVQDSGAVCRYQSRHREKPGSPFCNNETAPYSTRHGSGVCVAPARGIGSVLRAQSLTAKSCLAKSNSASVRHHHGPRDAPGIQAEWCHHLERGGREAGALRRTRS